MFDTQNFSCLHAELFYLLLNEYTDKKDMYGLDTFQASDNITNVN